MLRDVTTLGIDHNKSRSNVSTTKRQALIWDDEDDLAVKVVRALAEGGVTAAEITFTVPDAVDVIRQVRREVGDAVVLGAGTVLDSETACGGLGSWACSDALTGASDNAQIIGHARCVILSLASFRTAHTPARSR